MKKVELTARLFISENENERLVKDNEKLRRKLRASKFEEIKFEMKDYMTGANYEVETLLKKFRDVTGADLFDKVINQINNSKKVA